MNKRKIPVIVINDVKKIFAGVNHRIKEVNRYMKNNKEDNVMDTYNNINYYNLD
jgi:hypothetical protein